VKSVARHHVGLVYMQLSVPRHYNFLFWVVQYAKFPCYLRRAESGAPMYCPSSLFGRYCLRMTVMGTNMLPEQSI
jgi:hypothetical protein